MGGRMNCFTTRLSIIRVLLLNRGLWLLKGMNSITTASSKISVQMGSGTKFRLGYISEDYKCSANAPTAGYHFANSFLRRTIFSGHVTVRFSTAPFENLWGGG